MSRLYVDEGGEKMYEPRRNDDRLNTHNREILMMWHANMDWKPILSRHVVINYIEEYVAKVEKGSESFHDMLMCIYSIQNPNEQVSRAHRTLLCENIVDRDIGAQETYHILLELSLSECSRRFIILNVGIKGFKQVKVDEYNDHNDNSLIDAYRKIPMRMEHLSLIEAARSWSYDKHHHDEKWLPLNNTTIV